MATSTPQQQYTTCQYFPDANVHHIVFHEPTRKAFGYLEEIYSDITLDAPVNIIADVSESGALPLAYTFGKMRAWVRGLTTHPPARVALLHGAEPLVSIGIALFQALRLKHLTVRFFTARDGAYERALAWLVDGAAQTPQSGRVDEQKY